jgi:malonate transporter and related proteins
MANILDQLSFSLSVTGPICLMLFLGIYFRRSQLIDDHFIEVASRLVFKVTLPALLFLSVMSANHNFSDSAPLILYGLVASLFFFIMTTWIVKRSFKNRADHGVVIQGAFRGNIAIIALAYVSNAYGNSGMALAAVYVATLTLLYNVQAVFALTPKGTEKGLKSLISISKSLIKNPLIIAIIGGVLFNKLAIPLPKIALDAGGYFAKMTLPLALICSGGSLDISQLKHDKVSAWFSTSFKLLMSPLLITSGAFFFGFRGQELGIVFLVSSAPAASVSYVMARAMGGNATLAANIIVLTTLLSLVTSTLGLFFLSTLGVI